MQTQAQQTAPSATFAGADLFAIPSAQIDEWWPSVLHHIERWAEIDGTWSTEGIREELKEARAQLWCFNLSGVRGVWVTRVESTERCTWGVVWGCAGDLWEYREEAARLFAIIEDWFRDMGCEFVEWSGRDGWSRLFPDYRKHSVVLRKKL